MSILFKMIRYTCCILSKCVNFILHLGCKTQNSIHVPLSLTQLIYIDTIWCALVLPSSSIEMLWSKVSRIFVFLSVVCEWEGEGRRGIECVHVWEREGERPAVAKADLTLLRMTYQITERTGICPCLWFTSTVLRFYCRTFSVIHFL